MIEAITGSSGHIGKHLAAHLESRGHKVERIKHPDPDVAPHVWEFESPEFDHFFHLATYGSHRDQGDAHKTVLANYVYTWALLEGLNKTPYRAMILAGSSSEYGKKNYPMNEDDGLNPETIYAAAKAGITYLARVWARIFDKPIIVARPFTVYGPGEADYRFIPTVIRSCIKGDPMVLDLGGNHDFIYVDDVVDGLTFLADIAKDNKGETFNLGTGQMVDNKTIVESIEHLTGKRANITKTASLRPGDSNIWVADTTKTRLKGWEAQTSLAKGLAKTVDHYAKMYRL